MFGPITLHERLDLVGALSAWGPITAAGGQMPLEEFLPAWDAQPVEREEQTPEQMIAVMREVQQRIEEEG